MSICPYCGQKIFNIVTRGMLVSYEYGMVYFIEGRCDTLFLGIDGKIYKGEQCKPNANGAMKGRILHAEACPKFSKPKEALGRKKVMPYAV